MRITIKDPKKETPFVTRFHFFVLETPKNLKGKIKNVEQLIDLKPKKKEAVFLSGENPTAKSEIRAELMRGWK